MKMNKKLLCALVCFAMIACLVTAAPAATKVSDGSRRAGIPAGGADGG
ncbi:MAG: hypothetical protein HW377_1566 [Actinobacteria bacterium]|nr:hypothetical protein [Actinomycetota bacterium]